MKKTTVKSYADPDLSGSLIPSRLTVLPLRDMVIYPNMIFPVLIGREPSLRAVGEALQREKYIFVAAQSNAEVEEPSKDDVYRSGTIAKIIQLVKLPNNLVKILVDGVIHGRIKRWMPASSSDGAYLEADVQPIYQPLFQDTDELEKEFQALQRHAEELFINYVKVNRDIPPEVVNAFRNIDDPVRRLYYAAANVQQEVAAKQKILEKTKLRDQYFELISLLTSEIDVLKLEQDIDIKVQENIHKTQKRFLIQEQIRTLQQELEEDDEAFPELAKLREQIDTAGMPEEVLKKANEEYDKLKKMSAMSPDYGVLRNYLELLVSLPWRTATKDILDVANARAVLEADHFGLAKVKDRILEYIAVLNLVNSVQGQVLCFVGPPGVGKTSLARSIARAMGRKFVRFSLGGVRDEAEIRGHRKTYIGAMPGKIIQSMKRAGTVNPVILLDEVDKMAMDFRGDPSSALLEVLDPEQNISFNDHYLEVDYDLSKVLFIATANVKFDIPAPLLDRMELIELSSYVEFEKAEIARRHLIPKQLERHGIGDFPVRFTDEAIALLIHGYTKEAGVRNLERQIASVIRKIAQHVVEDIIREEVRLAADGGNELAAPVQADTDTPPVKKATRAKASKVSKVGNASKKTDLSLDTATETTSGTEIGTEIGTEQAAHSFRQQARERARATERVITGEAVQQMLKVPPHRRRKDDLSDKVGVVTGLAWTSMGGDTLPVEITMMPGKEKLTLTGKLGDVMKESAMAALSYVRTNSASLGVPEGFANEKEIHIHVPEGAIPKDGPSAGITMTMALISAASGRAARGDVAMTGEVTLRGNVLAIGGLNEKLLAAKAAGIATVLIPKDNEPELADLPAQTLEGLAIHPVAHIAEALQHVFRSRAAW
jgi:ATP-dependent Lon protease